MTSIYIICVVIIIASLGICFLFIKQNAEKRRKERKRLLKALEKRADELMEMLEGFPPMFLPSEINSLIYRCLVDTYERMMEIEKSQLYTEQYTTYSSALAKSLAQKTPSEHVKLRDSAQVAEVKRYLKFLMRLMQQLHNKKSIDNEHYSHCKHIITQLNHQMTVDSYTTAAAQAAQIDKPKLALHYHSLAEKILLQQSVLVKQKDQLVFHQQAIAQLEQQETTIEEAPENSEPNTEPNAEEWNDFDSGDDYWKKKNVYD